tara:strand:+ start:229 stop:681 length:453 start_codon:yes stop_codon:yes gene_type:complete
MRKFLGIIVLGLLWCNNVNAAEINLKNCKSNFGNHPFWEVHLHLLNKIGAELVRHASGMEERNVIYITERKVDVVYGYAISNLELIWEYVFKLNDDSFTRVWLSGTATPEQRERIPKTPEFENSVKWSITEDTSGGSFEPEEQKCERGKP